MATLRSTSTRPSTETQWLISGINDTTNFTSDEVLVMQEYWAYVANLAGYQSSNITFPDDLTKITEITFDTENNARAALGKLTAGVNRGAPSLAYHTLLQARSTELGLISVNNVSGFILVS
jgi:hypothetical protein